MTGNLEAPSVSIAGNNVDVTNYGIERGSNANGEYTKFPDGTLIQWARTTHNIIDRHGR